MKTATRQTIAPPVSLLAESDALLNHALELQRSIGRRAYELFATNGFHHGHDVDDWLKAESEVLQPMEMSVMESDNKIVLRACVEGYSAKEIEVKADLHRVFIAGKHSDSSQNKDEGAAHTECSRELFHEYVTSAEILPEKITAALTDGVLDVILPKSVAGKEAKEASRAA